MNETEVKPVLLPIKEVVDFKNEFILKSGKEINFRKIFSDIEFKYWQAQYIYILSGIPIGGKYYYENNEVEGVGLWNPQRENYENCYNIVATNDKRLIADGVHSVSSQFLQDCASCNGECQIYMEMTLPRGNYRLRGVNGRYRKTISKTNC